MKGSIYLLTNLKNGLMYVGQTKNLNRRKKEYNIKKITKKSQKYFLMYEIVKYGFNNFELIELESVPYDDLHEREIYWISKLNTTNPLIGYNKKTGGLGGRLNEESKIKMSETTSKFKHSDETKLKKSIPIISFRDGRFIKWESAKKMADAISSPRTHITRAARKGYKVKGYYIFYSDSSMCTTRNKNDEYERIRQILEEGVETIETNLFIII